MTAVLTETPRTDADHRSENRVEIFFVFTTCSDRVSWSQSVEAHQEIFTFDTTTASGRYPVNFVDPSGLAIGAPGTAESFIPIWGSGRQAINDFQTGHYVWGTINTVIAVSDVFLVKAAVTGVAKGAWKVGSHSWRATRAWMGKTGRASAGQQVHHWAIPQGRWGRSIPNAIKNQPWNLMPTESAAFHQALHGWGTMSQAEILWYGTPTWFKALLASEYGRIANDFRESGLSGASNECK